MEIGWLDVSIAASIPMSIIDSAAYMLLEMNEGIPASLSPLARSLD
jgi:hypothetical protein